MDQETLDALNLIAKIIRTNWRREALAGNLSQNEAIGYMILHRVGQRLHPDATTRAISTVVVGLIGGMNLSVPPPSSHEESLTLWLMNQRAC